MELEAIIDLDNDDGIGCMVLADLRRRSFAGADIKEMQSQTFMDVYLQDFITVAWEHVSKVRKPIIAAVSGYALGGGCEMAMMCDFICLTDNAKFGQPEITIGTIPGAGGTQRLTRFSWKIKLWRCDFNGPMMDAEEAERAD